MRPWKTYCRALIAGCVLVAWLAAMTGAGLHLNSSQANAHRQLIGRLQTRIAGGANFASLYVRDVLRRERAETATWRTDRHPSAQQLALATGAIGARSAILVNALGEIVGDDPPQRELLGVDVALAYPSIASALAGRSTVSDAIWSTNGGQPVVTFDVPFHTPDGRRVFSAQFPLFQTPLGQFSNHLLTVPGHRTYIIDSRGALIAGGGASPGGATLAQADPDLARALRAHRSLGTYDSDAGQQVFVSSKVQGTSWTLVGAEPAAQLFVSVNGGRTLSWLALVGLTLAGLIIIAIGTRLAGSRRRLIELAHELERLARIDSLTSVSNRRDLDERLASAACAARRSELPLSVLLIDIDHFKRINDTLGHRRGDDVLVDAAAAMRDSLRASDVLGRWGGEEFLAILPDTEAEGAAVVAERLRHRIRSTVLAGDRPVTVTIGVATLDASGTSTLIERADAALYDGKTSGRDTVVSSVVDREPERPLPALV